MAPDEVKELVSQCPELDETMRATGMVLISASLGGLENWRTDARRAFGKTRVTDGPYTESKEAGGLFIIEADMVMRRWPS
nr:YciI family protein [Achromobacter xylosoxidans]